jgi:hypothetical protein
MRKGEADGDGDDDDDAVVVDDWGPRSQQTHHSHQRETLQRWRGLPGEIRRQAERPLLLN